VLALGYPKFSAVEAVCLFAGPIGNTHEDHSIVILFDQNNETGARLRLGVNVVRKVAPDYFASRWFWPPMHQVLSSSKRLLRTVPPLAFGADFLTLLS
jgi:hypothetical protein